MGNEKLREALEAVYQDLGKYQADKSRVPVGPHAYHLMEKALAAKPQEQVRSCPMEINRWCEHCLTFHRFLPDLPQPATEQAAVTTIPSTASTSNGPSYDPWAEQPSTSQAFDARAWLTKRFPNFCASISLDLYSTAVCIVSSAHDEALQEAASGAQPTTQRLRDAAANVLRCFIGCGCDSENSGHRKDCPAIELREAWVAESKAAPAVALSEVDVIHLIVEMTDGVLWKDPFADGHVSRFTARLNALLRSGAAVSPDKSGIATNYGAVKPLAGEGS